jgi:hypothetical protein
VPSVETPNQISLVPELAPRQNKVSANLGTLTFQFRNWTTSAETGSVPKWGLTYTSSLNIHGGKQAYRKNSFDTFAPVVIWLAIRTVRIVSLHFELS